MRIIMRYRRNEVFTSPLLRYSFISKSCTCNGPTTTISYLTYSNLNPSTIIADRSSLLGLHQQYCIHTHYRGDSPIGIIRWTFAVLECDHTDTRIGNIWPETAIDGQKDMAKTVPSNPPSNTCSLCYANQNDASHITGNLHHTRREEGVVGSQTS